jgi:hypothetical protein
MRSAWSHATVYALGDESPVQSSGGRQHSNRRQGRCRHPGLKAAVSRVAPRVADEGSTTTQTESVTGRVAARRDRRRASLKDEVISESLIV